MTRKLMGDNGAILATYPAIGESGTRPQPALQNMGELAGLYQASIDNPTVDNFLIAGPLFFSFGIPAECMPPTATVIAQLRQAPMSADLSAQPPARHCGDRHVCGCHRDVPARLCPDCAQPRPQTGCSLRGHPISHASLAFRPNDRGLSLGHCTALSAAGPRQIVWSGIPPSSSSDGNHGDHHCPAITLAESLRRASHRFDPP